MLVLMEWDCVGSHEGFSHPSFLAHFETRQLRNQLRKGKYLGCFKPWASHEAIFLGIRDHLRQGPGVERKGIPCPWIVKESRGSLPCIKGTPRLFHNPW